MAIQTPDLGLKLNFMESEGLNLPVVRRRLLYNVLSRTLGILDKSGL
jgi:hypothetical protein